GMYTQGPKGAQIFRSSPYRQDVLSRALRSDPHVVIGMTGICTNTDGAKQPVVHDNLVMIHDGLVLNTEEILPLRLQHLTFNSEGEVLAAALAERLQSGDDVATAAAYVLSVAKGIINAVVVLPQLGKLALF